MHYAIIKTELTPLNFTPYVVCQENAFEYDIGLERPYFPGHIC